MMALNVISNYVRQFLIDSATHFLPVVKVTYPSLSLLFMSYQSLHLTQLPPPFKSNDCPVVLKTRRPADSVWASYTDLLPLLFVLKMFHPYCRPFFTRLTFYGSRKWNVEITDVSLRGIFVQIDQKCIWANLNAKVPFYIIQNQILLKLLLKV